MIKHSEQTAELFAALVKTQSELPAVGKDKTAKIPTKKGGEFTYKYADLDTCMSTVKDVLAKNGLAIIAGGAQELAKTDVAIETMVIHTSGQWISHVLTCDPGTRDARAVGSAITYLRRYGLSIVGLTTEDDTDGARPRQEREKNKTADPDAAQDQQEAQARTERAAKLERISTKAKSLNEYFKLEGKPGSDPETVAVITPSVIFAHAGRTFEQGTSSMNDLLPDQVDTVLDWLDEMTAKGEWIVPGLPF